MYDYQVTNSEGRVFDKLVFISWQAPPSAPLAIRHYTAHDEFLRRYMAPLRIRSNGVFVVCQGSSSASWHRL